MWVITLGNKPVDRRVFETRVFDSAESFVRQFREGLYSILRGSDLTATQVVLVANNAIAMGDLDLFREAMSHIFRTVNGASDEDRQILSRLAKIRNPMRVLRRRVTDSGLVLIYNELGKFDSEWAVDLEETSLWRPFDQTKFGFNDVPNQMFASVGLNCGRVHLFYCKFPYGAYHVLLVPVPENNYPQFLNFGWMALWDEVYSMIRAVLPGSVMGYNSLGAYATVDQLQDVNQLHFHLIYGMDKLVIPGRWDGGIGQTVSDRFAAWPLIDKIQAANQPFNLVQDADGLTIVRQHGQRVVGPTWSTSFGWFELAGGFVINNWKSFKTLAEPAIWATYQDLVIRAA